MNQCMKFYAKADMQVATFRNCSLLVHKAQSLKLTSTLVKPLAQTIPSMPTLLSNSQETWESLSLSPFIFTLAVFVIGSAYFVFAWVSTRKGRGGSSKLEHPLVESKGIIA